MAASMFRLARNCGQCLIRSNLKETYSRQKRGIKFRKEDNDYVPKMVPYRTYPNESLDQKYPDIEISSEDFKYVERLFPAKTVPEVPKHEKFPTPSGWFPPDYNSLLASPKKYYVRRSRNHMLPVYIEVNQKSRQVTTKVKHIIGDLRALDAEIKKHLKEVTGQDIDSQVHEVGSFLRYRGNHTDTIAKYLLDQGF